jgi:endonuclease/exonuclease/phosphatase family metal-dependent hydrolase
MTNVIILSGSLAPYEYPRYKYSGGIKMKKNSGKKVLLKGAVLSAAVLFSLISGSCFGGCEVYPQDTDGKSANGASLSIASWNLQALFDEKDDGWEYEEYRDGSGWTAEKYRARLNHIAKAISEMGAESPSLVALIEVENEAIVKKLSTEYLGDEGYKHCFFAGSTGYSLGVGLISKYPFLTSTAHSINIAGEIIPRPIAEITVAPHGKKLTVFICHWKSKLGGDEQTEKLRREAVRVILRRQKEILRENPGTPILVLGDLNENYDEYYRRGGAQICALMPDDPEAAIIANRAIPEFVDETENAAPVSELSGAGTQDFLILSEEKPPCSAFFEKCTGIFYSPWFNEMKNGSYFYSGSWETIDHFLLNENFFKSGAWQFKDCFVIDSEPFVNSKGEPDT